MPIDPIHLQRRHAEQGRIRLGHKTGEKGRPAKLEAFRFTSPNRVLIEALAELYGGEPQAWDNAGIPEWEVYSTSTSLPIIVVKGGVSQWFEHWTAAGIGHRCDGTKDAKTGVACDPDDRLHQLATEKPTTRLSVMLPELDSTGVWRMETHGWNAAAEVPMIGELAAHVGSMVPARLHLVERRKVIQVNGRPQTSRFVVPVVDLEIKVRELAQIVSGSEALQIEGPKPTAQITADAGVQALEIYRDQIEACTTRAEVNDLWRHISSQSHLYPPVKEALTARGQSLPPETPPEAPGAPTAQDGPPPATPEPAQVNQQTGEVVDAEIVEEDPVEADRAWQDALSLAGKSGMGTMEVMSEFESFAGHGAAEGTADEFRRFAQAVLSS